jgi:ferrochelatase
MQVGNPRLEAVVQELIASGIDRLIVFPMYPQYSATTTASALDMLFKALMRERRVPSLRVVPPYYDHPAYLDAVVTLIREQLASLSWEPEHYLLSFHGIPVKYAERGDPYPQQVECTSRLLLERLGWPAGQWTQSFQSLFGKDPWLQPYTDRTLQDLASRGIKRVFVATPGFTTDCLETIDEIGFEVRGLFRRAGGEALHLCPCLNDHSAWIRAMHTIVWDQAQGWI